MVVVLCLEVVAAGVFVIRRRNKAVVTLSLASVVALAFFLTTYTPEPLPAPAALAAAVPAASPPPGVAAYQLPTAVIHRSAAFAYRGGSFFDARDFAMAAVLVEHPRGDVLIDSGLARGIDEQLVEMMPLPFRMATDLARGRSVVEQLDAAGYDRRRLRNILLTHAHWDHISGAVDLPDVPILITAEERQFVASGGWVMAFARRLPSTRFIDYGFEETPFLGFPRSHDLYGDGAIVIVPAPGHTPGSVIVFVTSSNGQRVALVGDLAWQREGILEREERPWFMRQLADVDSGEVRQGLLRMSAILARAPDLQVVPAHDARAYEHLPRLTAHPR